MDEELWNRVRLGDKNAETHLFVSHVHIVERTAHRIYRRLPRHIQLEDLRAAGFEGLWKAIRSFSPEKGVPFEAYATMRVRGHIIDELRNTDELSRRHRGQVKKAQTAYGEQLMFTSISLDSDDRMEWIVDDSALHPEDAAVRASEVAELNRAITRLSHQEQLVLAMVFVEGLNLTETAEVLDLSRSRVSSIYSGALKSLKGSLIRRRFQG